MRGCIDRCDRNPLLVKELVKLVINVGLAAANKGFSFHFLPSESGFEKPKHLAVKPVLAFSLVASFNEALQVFTAAFEHSGILLEPVFSNGPLASLYIAEFADFDFNQPSEVFLLDIRENPEKPQYLVFGSHGLSLNNKWPQAQ